MFNKLINRENGVQIDGSLRKMYKLRCTMPCIYYLSIHLSIKGWHCWDLGTGLRKERETGREKLKRKGG